MYQTYLKKILLGPIQYVQWNNSTEAYLKEFGNFYAHADPIAVTGRFLGDILLQEVVLTSLEEYPEFLQLCVLLLFHISNNYMSISYVEDDRYSCFLGNIVVDHGI